MTDALADIALYEAGLACPIWRGHYQVSLAGQVNVRGTPPQVIFEQAWTYLLKLHDNLPRALGNMLAHSTARWGEMYTEELMQQSGKKYFTLAQYKSTYARMPEWVQDKHTDVRHTYCRIAAQADPPQQDAILTRVEAGEFDKPDPNYPDLDTKEKRVRRVVRMIRGEPVPKPELPIPCPICHSANGDGWLRSELLRPTCSHCGAHADELTKRLAELRHCIQELYRTGDRTPLDNFVRSYRLVEQEAQ